MRILVLDTIHGGTAIGRAYVSRGHSVDIVDVYRNTTPDVARDAATRTYDLIVAPVHLDPEYPLLHRPGIPVITHHEAVRQLLGNDVPFPMVEITGARGKTTTAHALAHLMPGPGVLHTSVGTLTYPDRTILWKASITPASVLAAARHASDMGGWLIAEESLGVSGAGDLAIITSCEDYPCASGKKSALAEKCSSAKRSRKVLVAEGVATGAHDQILHLEDIARCHGTECCITLGDSICTFSNPLLGLPAYRSPLALAGSAAAILGISPAALETFAALPGRMSEQERNGIVIIDNANSGTNVATTVEAARYARERAGVPDLTLVIGTVEGDGAVCEGFSSDEIAQAVRLVHPERIVYVGKEGGLAAGLLGQEGFRIDGECETLEDAQRLAAGITSKGSIVLAVKTWR